MTIKIKGKEYYLTDELSRILPLSIDSIRKYIRTGKLKGKKIGLFYVVSNQNLEEFLETGTHEGSFFMKKKVES